MKLTEETKAYIDSLSYQDLLHRWRFAPIGNAWLQDETGEYWATRMRDLRELPGGDVEHVRSSKAIGWEE